MTESEKAGKELIVIAFSAILILSLLMTIYLWLVIGSFPWRDLLSTLLTVVICIKVLTKSEWAKYGAIIWSVFNASVAIYFAVQAKLYVFIPLALSFMFLVCVLTFFKSVDDYLATNENKI
jgi:hypothetical protein